MSPGWRENLSHLPHATVNWLNYSVLEFIQALVDSPPHSFSFFFPTHFLFSHSTVRCDVSSSLHWHHSLSFRKQLFVPETTTRTGDESIIMRSHFVRLSLAMNCASCWLVDCWENHWSIDSSILSWLSDVIFISQLYCRNNWIAEMHLIVYAKVDEIISRCLSTQKDQMFEHLSVSVVKYLNTRHEAIFIYWPGKRENELSFWWKHTMMKRRKDEYYCTLRLLHLRMSEQIELESGD